MICCSWLARRSNWTMAKRDRKSTSSVAVCYPLVPDDWRIYGCLLFWICNIFCRNRLLSWVRGGCTTVSRHRTSISPEVKSPLLTGKRPFGILSSQYPSPFDSIRHWKTRLWVVRMEMELDWRQYLSFSNVGVLVIIARIAEKSENLKSLRTHAPFSTRVKPLIPSK